jgi:transposase
VGEVIPAGVDIYVGREPIDLRWGFERLSGAVLERLGRRPRDGALFVFFGKRRSAMKIFYFDGSGLCIFYKRLDRGTFRLPTFLDERAQAIEIDERMLEDLLAGVDVELPTKH